MFLDARIKELEALLDTGSQERQEQAIFRAMVIAAHGCGKISAEDYAALEQALARWPEPLVMDDEAINQARCVVLAVLHGRDPGGLARVWQRWAPTIPCPVMAALSAS